MPPEESGHHRPVANGGETDVALVRALCLFWILAVFISGWVGIGRAPFWIDESIAVFPARGILEHGVPIAPYDLDFMPWQLKFGYWDPATPLYRYCLATVFAVFGFSETVARGSSWVLGFLALIPIYAAGRALFGRTAAWMGIALIAGSPTFGIFAREARHFSFVMLVGSLMIWALLTAAKPGAAPHRRMLWLPALVGALLAQTIGYLALPVAAAYVVAVGPRRFLSGDRTSLTVCAVSLSVYAAVMAVFWHTLPFFHVLACHNRPVGCQPHPLYYLRVLYGFLTPLASRDEIWEFLAPPATRLESGMTFTAAAGPVLFLVGLGVAAYRTLHWPRRQWAMLWIWLLVPLLLLSTREVKFPRFLYQWAFPVAMLISAYAVAQLAGLFRSRWPRRGVLVVLFALLAVSPQWYGGGRESEVRHGWSSGLERFVRGELWNAPTENWEFLAAQSDFLEERVRDGDVIVTSFDDASLQYYVRARVYGFLTSRRSDLFFVNLLRDAERRDRHVWFVDTMPMFNFCLSNEAEPRSVDCRRKYPRFYDTCSSNDDPLSRRCRRVTLSEILRARR